MTMKVQNLELETRQLEEGDPVLWYGLSVKAIRQADTTSSWADAVALQSETDDRVNVALGLSGDLLITTQVLDADVECYLIEPRRNFRQHPGTFTIAVAPTETLWDMVRRLADYWKEWPILDDFDLAIVHWPSSSSDDPKDRVCLEDCCAVISIAIFVPEGGRTPDRQRSQPITRVV